MGKKYNHLWAQAPAFENLLLAFKKAARGKRSKPGVAAFEFELEPNLLRLQGLPSPWAKGLRLQGYKTTPGKPGLSAIRVEVIQQKAPPAPFMGRCCVARSL